MRTKVEVRFIGGGSMPAPARSMCVGAPEERLDLYVLTSEPRRSVKIRDAAGSGPRVECKELLSEWLVPAGDRDARCQRWRKEVGTPPDVVGPTIAVRKRRWRRGRLDLVELDVGDERCWSVALTGPDEPPRRTLDAMDALLDGALARSCAYSELLAERAVARV